MSSRKPQKPQVGIFRSRESLATPNTSNALSIAASSAASLTVNPITSKSKRTRKAPEYSGFESSVCSVSNPEPISALKLQKQNNLVIETVNQKEASQPPAVETSFELPVKSPPEPQPVRTWSPVEYDYADYEGEVSMNVFDAENEL